MTNNEQKRKSKAEIILERKRERRRLQALKNVSLLPKSTCDHPWHENPGLIMPCPECGEE